MLKSFETPAKRMYHAGELYGGYIYVHGGFNAEEKKILDSQAVYDIGIMNWLNVIEQNVWVRVH